MFVLAEEEGFEPSVPLQERLISNQVQSTTLPPLRMLHAAGQAAKGANHTDSVIPRQPFFITVPKVLSVRRLFGVILMSLIHVPVSFGELLDKIAILEIKSERMRDPAKLANVRRELDELSATWSQSAEAKIDIADLLAALKAVNQRLWVIEDDIRIKESKQEFDAEFIRLARAVYVENDERARVKREINIRLGSALIEEKSYQDYRAKPVG